MWWECVGVGVVKVSVGVWDTCIHGHSLNINEICSCSPPPLPIFATYMLYVCPYCPLSR